MWSLVVGLISVVMLCYSRSCLALGGQEVLGLVGVERIDDVVVRVDVDVVVAVLGEVACAESYNISTDNVWLYCKVYRS
jgi:hypothetical protein